METTTAKTQITMILDRSGSMESIREDVIGGFNAFIQEQKAEPGEVIVTLVQFDGQAPYDIIYDRQAIEKIEILTKKIYQPRGSTPLLDAMGRGILTLAAQLANEETAQKTEKVIFMTITDGMENASREFTQKQVQELIKEKTEKDGWQFVYLSADLSAIHEAEHLGVDRRRTRHFEKSRGGVAMAFASVAKESRSYRQGKSKEFTFEEDNKENKEILDIPAFLRNKKED